MAVNNIAKWNGSTWSAFGSGMDGTVYALAVIGSDLYVGGIFDTPAAYGQIHRQVEWQLRGRPWARAWTVPSAGPSGSWVGPVCRRTFLHGRRNNGQTTSPNGMAALGQPWARAQARHVWALAVNGSDLYAGGTFDTAGGVTVTTLPNGTAALGPLWAWALTTGFIRWPSWELISMWGGSFQCV